MKKRESFRHLTDHDRDRIQALRESGHTQKEIAAILFVTKATISRELKRNSTRVGRYIAIRAQKDAEEKRSRAKRPGMKIEENPSIKRFVIKELKRLRSPDEIAGYMKKTGMHPRVGTAAIYKWLYSEGGKQYCTYLCTRRQKKRRQSRFGKRQLIPERISLRQRPDSPGLVHAEGDLFVSPRTSKACGLLVVAKESKLFMGSLVDNKTTAMIVPAMQKITRTLNADTCTLDNGIENIHHRQFGVATYFCDKGSPWQKPDVEGGIGLIRRWFIPKGVDLDDISDETYQSQLHLLNHKYRKSLGYRSAYEVAIERGIIDRVPKISLAAAVAFR
jgi:IS30 family transposase